MKVIFDFEKFWGNNFFAHVNFRTFLEYIEDEEAIIVYANKLGFGIDEEGNKTTVKPETRLIINQSTKENIHDTMEILKNQMIVYMATIVETVIKEFFYCIFMKRPERLKVFQHSNINELGFTLHEFIKYETKEEYLMVLARRAANISSNGELGKILKRIKGLCNFEVDKNLEKSLIDLNEKRNLIVHESKLFKLDIEYFIFEWNEIDRFIKLLAIKLKELGVEVIDNGDLMESN